MDTASGIGKVDTASGNEHATRQNRTEVKTDGHGARKRSHEVLGREGAGVALCGCGRPLSGDGGRLFGAHMHADIAGPPCSPFRRTAYIDIRSFIKIVKHRRSAQTR